MVTIGTDKEYYYIDIDAINEYMFKKIECDTDERELIMDGNKTVIQETTLKRNNGNEKYINAKSDMIKTMLDVMYSAGIESNF